ncbi:MAG: transglutaminase-like cysteine peptidase [Acidobacteriota bacterium]
MALIHRLWARLVDLTRRSTSPWKRVSLPVPAGAFGPGSHREFAHYFEGESHVRVGSIDEIVEWLLNCRYMTDALQFNQRDLWQHPVSFETLRCGDCEDFALWAWRKLAEMGVEAEFYVGRVVRDDEPEIDRQHAWVVYRVDGVPFLFEPAASRPRMIRRLAEAMSGYVPYFAVDGRLRTFAFNGYAIDASRSRVATPSRGRQS